MSESALPSESGFSPPWPAGRSEERLARRAAAGDERAFAAIFRRYGPELHRYCLAILGNGADAQDVLQNVMVKALRSLPGERREIKLKPWLYRVAHNESVELLRRRRGVELDPEAPAPGPGLAETAAQRQRLRDLLADLEQLPERQRGALLMRELSGLGFEQIGGALGISAPAARQTVYEARLGLREMEAGREMSCDLVTKAISDGDGRVLRRRDVRAHLRTCADCRAFRAGIDDRRHDLAAISPLPAVAVAALTKGALGSAAGGAAAGGGAAGGTAAGTAAVGVGAAGGASLVKAVATVAVVTAIGVGAADRAGLVQIGGTGSGTQAKERVVGGAHPPQAGPDRRAAAALAGSAAAHRAAGDVPASAGVRQAAAVPGSAGPAARLLPGRGNQSHEGRPAEPRGPHGKGLQGDKGAHGSGPPAHSHAGGNSASAHAIAGHGQQNAAEHKASHGPTGSPAAGSKGGGHAAGSKGKGSSHTAAPPPSSPHKPAEPTSPQAEAPAAGATESTPTPETKPGPPVKNSKAAVPAAESSP